MEDNSLLKMEKKIDNRFVVPYNPCLLLLLKAHINFEIILSDARCIRYINKYLYKQDVTVLKKYILDCEKNDKIIDETEIFKRVRHLGPVSSIWHLFGFPITFRYPSVLKLDIQN